MGNEDDKCICKMIVIIIIVRGFGDGDESLLVGSEDGILLEFRYGK